MPTLTIDRSGWLPAAKDVRTARTNVLETDAPVAVVWHATASRGSTAAHIRYLAEGVQTGRGASFHFGVGRPGNLVQLASVLVGTNHVGARREIAGAVRSVNRSTIGIEVEGACRLMRVGAEWRAVANPCEPPRAWRPDLRFTIPADEVEELATPTGPQHWHRYTLAQEQAAGDLLAALVQRFGWGRDVCGIAHSALEPHDRVDPGPVWMGVHLPRILDRVFPPSVT